MGTSASGMVSAPQPLAVEAGVKILADGGNAVDAAIAVAFVQGVVDPQMCGLGGGGSVTVHLAHSSETRVCDFYAPTPLAATPSMFADRVVSRATWGGFILSDRANEIGYLSVCTPSAVQGLGSLHARFGSMPWLRLLDDAIAIAEERAPVYHHVHERWNRQVGDFVDCITRHQATRTCEVQYMRGGAMLGIGERMDTRAYAHTLKRLAAEGPRDFIDGETAQTMVRDMADNGGMMTLDDLAAAKPEWRRSVSGNYRGYRVEGPPPPGAGVAVVAILNILSGCDLAVLGHNSAEHLHIVASAIRLGLDDWKAHTGDPAFVENPVAWLTSQERADELRQMIGSASETTTAARDEIPDGRDTTHISIMTSDGSAVSMTHTLGLGSGVVTPGLGFMYNNAMMLFDPRPGGPNSIAPRRVRQHGLASCILFKDESPWLAVGAPGGHGIISGVVQTISNIIDFAMSPGDAVSAPRIHCEGPVIDLEARIPRGIAEDLRARGHEIRHSLYSYDFFSGRPHVVMRDPASKALSGGADPRGGGMALSS